MTTIQSRRGTLFQWNAANPVLASGEVGFETDTGKHKIGDGTRVWSALPYFLDETSLLASTTGAIKAQVFDPTDLGYDVIVVAGQSNASGYGEGYDARLDPVHSRIWQYADSGTLIGQVCVAQDPLYHHAQAPAGRIGFSMTLARLFADVAHPNRRVLIVPVAHGGSGMRPQGSGVWDPDYVPGAFVSLYANMVAQITAALALTIDGQTAPNNRILGVFWHQGETDAVDSTNAGLYGAKFDRMVQQLRIDIPSTATVPFVVGQMVPETIPTTNFESTVDAFHIDTPRRHLLSGFAYGPLGYSQIKAGEGSVHYSGAGQRVLAPRMYRAYLRALTNVAGTAPIAPASVTFTQNAAATGVAVWPQPSGRVTGYSVQFKVNTGAWTNVTRSATLVDVQQAITGLSNGDVVQVRVATINDQGTSAWTTSAAVTMVAVPAQVTSLATGTATSQTQPLTWSAAARAIAYLVEYKTHAGSTWLTFATVTGLAATVTGLAASTSYDFRVTATNGAGAGTASTTVTASTAAPNTLSADVGVTPQVAYSVARRLVAGYAGSAFRVRRSSDNTETDIGFATGTDNVDTTALTTFVGANNGFVSKVYDQSGNGWDFAQATTTKQPQIVTAGTVNTVNSKPAMLFDGVDDTYLDTTAGRLSIWAGGAIDTSCAVLKPTLRSSPATQLLYGEVATAAANTSSHVTPMAFSTSGGTIVKPLIFTRADDATAPINNANLNTDTADVEHVQWRLSDGSITRIDLDAAVGTPAGNLQNIPDVALTVNQRHFGGFGTLVYKGSVSEFARWSTVLTDTQIAAGKTNQKSYYGTP